MGVFLLLTNSSHSVTGVSSPCRLLIKVPPNMKNGHQLICPVAAKYPSPRVSDLGNKTTLNAHDYFGREVIKGPFYFSPPPTGHCDHYRHPVGLTRPLAVSGSPWVQPPGNHLMWPLIQHLLRLRIHSWAQRPTYHGDHGRVPSNRLVRVGDLLPLSFLPTLPLLQLVPRGRNRAWRSVSLPCAAATSGQMRRRGEWEVLIQ